MVNQPSGAVFVYVLLYGPRINAYHSDSAVNAISNLSGLERLQFSANKPRGWRAELPRMLHQKSVRHAEKARYSKKWHVNFLDAFLGMNKATLI